MSAKCQKRTFRIVADLSIARTIEAGLFSAVLCDGSSCLQHEQRQYQDPRHNGEGRVDTFVP
jgi:hypothetical protein